LKRQAALSRPEPPAPAAAPPAESVAEPTPPPAPEPEVAAKEPEEKPTVTAMLPPPKGGAPAIELAPNNSGLSAANPGRIKPAIPFNLALAKLPLPAQGRRVLSFGEKTQYGGNSKGIVIETRWSGQVTSPCDGWIVYAGEFRSYGQLLIINAGGGYHVLMAGLSQIDAQPGQFVLAAEPVGTMSGAQKQAPESAQSGGPVLYVEFRKDGEPIDPDPWWVVKQQKAQNEQKVQG
jgi:septal ring factor EnvC (AmiA/AmiB activator)